MPMKKKFHEGKFVQSTHPRNPVKSNLRRICRPLVKNLRAATPDE